MYLTIKQLRKKKLKYRNKSLYKKFCKKYKQFKKTIKKYLNFKNTIF